MATNINTLDPNSNPSNFDPVTIVTERQVIDSNDFLDWSSLDKVFEFSRPQSSQFLPNSFVAQSSQGLEVKVDIPVATSPSISTPFIFETTSQGFQTNFDCGDFILFGGFQPGGYPALGNPGPLTLTFDTPVLEVGTQIAVDDSYLFTVTISAFDSDNNLLGTFSTEGTSSTELDNSAIFLGVRSHTNNIAKVIYTVSETERAIGINKLTLKIKN